MVARLFIAGDHVPEIPFNDVVGKEKDVAAFNHGLPRYKRLDLFSAGLIDFDGSGLGPKPAP